MREQMMQDLIQGIKGVGKERHREMFILLDKALWEIEEYKSVKPCGAIQDNGMLCLKQVRDNYRCPRHRDTNG